jgi:toxin ParE1/3/4
MSGRKWRVRVGDPASRDLAATLHWTAANFGAEQARRYKEAFIAALRELSDGPDVSGSRARDEIAPGIRTLHVARHGRRGRHFILYRSEADRTIAILRILHDSMDLRRHIPKG